tara:strand:- start:163 stop:483 length:321 start_codon:yes stop_codon:yes gene_type:complete
MTTTADVISVAMSRQDGARAAAVMFADGRLTPGLIDDCRADGRDWGDSDFSIGDGALAAFMGSGCECFSRHHQLMGENWKEDHVVSFWHGFVTVARECLWSGGFKQ